jgi:hypothetical protein
MRSGRTYSSPKLDTQAPQLSSSTAAVAAFPAPPREARCETDPFSSECILGEPARIPFHTPAFTLQGSLARVQRNKVHKGRRFEIRPQLDCL